MDFITIWLMITVVIVIIAIIFVGVKYTQESNNGVIYRGVLRKTIDKFPQTEEYIKEALDYYNRQYKTNAKLDE